MSSSSRRSKRSASFPSLIAAAKKEHSKKTDGDEVDGEAGCDLSADATSRSNPLFAVYSILFGSDSRNSSIADGGAQPRLHALSKLTPRRRLSIIFLSLTLLIFFLGTTFNPFTSSEGPPHPSIPASVSHNRTVPETLSGEQITTAARDPSGVQSGVSKQAWRSSVRASSDVGESDGMLKRGQTLAQAGTQSRNPLTWLWGEGGGGEGIDYRRRGGNVKAARQPGLAGVSRVRRLKAAVVVCRHKLTECQETLRLCEEKERGGGYKSTERKRSMRNRLRGSARCDLKAKVACQSLATLCREAHRSLKEQQGDQLSLAALAEGEEEEEEEEEDLADREGPSDGPPDCKPFSALDSQRRCICPALFKGRRRCARRDWGSLELSPLLVPEVYGGDFLLSLESLSRVYKETGSSQLRVNLPEKEVPWRIVWEPGPEGSKASLLPSLLAQRDPVRGQVHRTCAVVGNSGLLLMERLGHEIDAHSAVFRFNGAPTVGFESHVGSKTTFRLVNSKWYKFRETEEEMVIFQSRSASHFLKYIDFLVSTEHLGEPFYLMAPQFTSWLANTAHNLSSLVRPPPPDPGGSSADGTQQVEAPPAEFIPTSGWIGLMMAIQMCRKVTLYGFQVSEAHGMPYHYHNQCSQPHSDRDKIEWRLVKGLVKAKLASFRNPCVLVCHHSKKECKICMAQHISPSQLAEGMALWSSLPLPEYCLKQQQEAASNGEQTRLPIIPDWMETGLPTN